MSARNLGITVTGWIGSEVRLHHENDGGVPFVSFRVASTRRFVDRDGQWRDGQTQWFTVKAWRGAAVNIGHSLRKGDPVVVHGRLSTQEWAATAGPRTDLVIDAESLGHDLAYGTSHFSRSAARSTTEETTTSDAAQREPSGEPAGDGEAILRDGEARFDVTELPELPDEPETEPGDDAAERLLVGATTGAQR